MRCWSLQYRGREVSFLRREPRLWGWAVGSCRHSTPVLSAHVTSRSVSPTCVTHPTPSGCMFRGRHSPPRPSLRVQSSLLSGLCHGPENLHKTAGPQALPSPALSATAASGRAFGGSVQPACPCTWDIFPNDVKHRYILFLVPGNQILVSKSKY